MSHLGRRLSALIDGELSHAERDQVHAHLVRCEECRAEAAALRTLKRRVRGLGETPADRALTSRLIALAAMKGDGEMGGEPPPSRPRFPTAPRGRPPMAATGAPAAGPPAWESARNWRGGEPSGAGNSGQMAPASPAGRGRGHARYVVAGAVAALAVSLGAAAFAAGGGQGGGPKVVPEVDMYTFEHAVTTGGLPFVPAGQSRGLAPAKRTGSAVTP